jgi:hypothetical protein
VRSAERGRTGHEEQKAARCERAQLDRSTEQDAKPDVRRGAQSPVGRSASPQSAGDQRYDITRKRPAAALWRRLEQRAEDFPAPRSLRYSEG